MSKAFTTPTQKAIERFTALSTPLLAKDMLALARALDQFGWPERAGLVAAAADRLIATKEGQGDG
jgi:hypothetical protein